MDLWSSNRGNSKTSGCFHIGKDHGLHHFPANPECPIHLSNGSTMTIELLTWEAVPEFKSVGIISQKKNTKMGSDFMTILKRKSQGLQLNG